LIPSFDDAVLDSISRTLGDALVGSNISRLFEACGIEDQTGESTKWKRLYYTFIEIQRTDRCANRIGALIESALAPARWTSNDASYHALREEVNRALVMSGLEVGPNGKLHSVKAASTLDEAKERANRLRAILEKRGVHAAVLASCRDLLLKDGNYFHAVFEATKSIADRLRQMSGSRLDGNALVDETLEKGARPFPMIALNRFDSPSLVNEQQGIAHLTRGLFHAFRNVLSHEPAVRWTIAEEDALDMMTIASLVHRRLDRATVTTQFQSKRP
jgi:uncharacterized protein (TIGR02391 family)